MPFEPGNKHSPGRKKGIPNKTTAELRAMIMNSLEAVGGEDYLRQQAIDNPTAYMSLIGKVIPKETTLSGPDGGPVQHSVNIRFDD